MWSVGIDINSASFLSPRTPTHASARCPFVKPWTSLSAEIVVFINVMVELEHDTAINQPRGSTCLENVTVVQLLLKFPPFLWNPMLICSQDMQSLNVG